MRNPIHSIRWRIQAWYGLVLLLVIGAFCITSYKLAFDTQMRRIDADIGRLERNLFHALFNLVKAIPPEPSPPPAPPPLETPQRIPDLIRSGKLVLPTSEMNVFKGQEPGYAYFILLDTEGKRVLQSSNMPSALFDFPKNNADFAEEFRTVGTRRERLHNNPGGKSIIGRDITPEIEEMRHFVWSLCAFGSGVWLLGLFGGWWVASRAIRPIARISHTATRIAEGNLNERIGASDTDSELDELCRVLDRTFERLRQAIEQQKQFTADASHELRTPVTILLSETQRILKRPRTEQEYKDAILTCQEAANRMRKLTESLLLLARQDSPEAEQLRVDCDLAACTTEALSQLERQAQTAGITLSTSLAHAPLRADPAALSILVSNLVSNAIQYNRPGGTVWISTEEEPGGAKLIVRDDGLGISKEVLPRIFDRFYRAEKSRGQQNAHAGIGLAIVKSIVENHKGSVVVESTPAHGTTFTVRLPCRVA